GRVTPVKAGEAALGLADVERILRISGLLEREYLAGIVQRLAERIRAPDGKLVVYPAAHPGLQRVVDRLRRILARQDPVLRQDASITSRVAPQKTHARIIRARLRRQPSRDQLRESREVERLPEDRGREAVQEVTELRVDDLLLEQANPVGSQVANLEHIGAVELPLDSKRPLLRIGRPEIRVDYGLRQRS